MEEDEVSPELMPDSTLRKGGELHEDIGADLRSRRHDVHAGWHDALAG